MGVYGAEGRSRRPNNGLLRPMITRCIVSGQHTPSECCSRARVSGGRSKEASMDHSQMYVEGTFVYIIKTFRICMIFRPMLNVKIMETDKELCNLQHLQVLRLKCQSNIDVFVINVANDRATCFTTSHSCLPPPTAVPSHITSHKHSLLHTSRPRRIYFPQRRPCTYPYHADIMTSPPPRRGPPFPTAISQPGQCPASTHPSSPANPPAPASRPL